MTRLLERLEHALGTRPHRTTAPPRHRSDRRATVTPIVPAPDAEPSPSDPAAGFLDCRGEWHAWEDAS
jgi:hypothetical protein